MNRYYSGIGSRQTPDEIKRIMSQVARRLNKNHGYVLRSGGALGADTAFASGAGMNKEIFLASDSTPEASKIAQEFHPKWKTLSSNIRNLMTRNVFIVLGRDLLTPSKFVLCWTKCGSEKGEQTSASSGGTGHSIRIASHYGIPIFNLKKEETFQKIKNWLESCHNGPVSK